MSYRQTDGSRAEDEDARKAAERAEMERVGRALKSQTIWTPAATQIARGIGLATAALAALVALVAGGSALYRRSLPCGGDGVRCIDGTHLEVCEGESRTTMRCASCRGGSCSPPADPVPGDACRLCEEGIGLRALPEEVRCSPDKRTVMDCAGCFGVWTATKTCAPDEECVANMGVVRCEKR